MYTHPLCFHKMFYPEVFCPQFPRPRFSHGALHRVRASSAYVITWQLALPQEDGRGGGVPCRHDGQFSPSTHRVMGAQSYSGGCLWSLRLPDRQPWCHPCRYKPEQASGAQFKLGASQGKQCQHLGKRRRDCLPGRGTKVGESPKVTEAWGTRGPGLDSHGRRGWPVQRACASSWGGCCQVVSVSFAPVVSAATPRGEGRGGKRREVSAVTVEVRRVDPLTEPRALCAPRCPLPPAAPEGTGQAP